jgi:acid-sensing ion channel, other
MSSATWNGKKAYFTEIINREAGIAFTFNLIDAERLLDFDKWEKNLKYFVIGPFWRGRKWQFYVQSWMKLNLNIFHCSLSPDFNFTYGNNVDTSKFPLKTSSFGQNHGLTITFKRDKENVVNSCLDNTWRLHYSTDLHTYGPVEFDYGKSYDILITPLINLVDSSLEALKPKDRKCYLDGERKLKYFKMYSKVLCDRECLSFVILENCGCVPYFMSRNESMKVCNIKGMTCASGFDNAMTNDFNYLYEKYGVCECLSSCNEVFYIYEILEKPYDKKFSKEWDSNLFKKDFINSLLFRLTNETTLHFKYKHDEILPMLSYEKFALKDFLSFAGGLLGLFAGISVLSLIELFYFFTIRLIVDVWRTFRMK